MWTYKTTYQELLSTKKGQNANLLMHKTLFTMKVDSEYFLPQILIVFPTLSMVTHIPVKTWENKLWNVYEQFVSFCETQ